jgi:hypothetical protein
MIYKNKMYKDDNCVSMILNRLPLVPLQNNIVSCNWCGIALQRLPHMFNWTCVCRGGLEIDPHCVVQRCNLDTLIKVIAGAFFILCAGVTIEDDYPTNTDLKLIRILNENSIILKIYINGNKHRSKANVPIKNIQRSKSKFNDNKK